MVEFLNAKRRDKRNRTDFYLVMILIYAKRNAARYPPDDMPSLSKLEQLVLKHILQTYVFTYLLQNVLIPSSPKISQGAKCPNTLKLNTTTDNELPI